MTETVTLVTGALTGIGRATATVFSRYGGRLLVSGIDEIEGNRFADELNASGCEAEFLFADVRDETQISALVDRAVKHFGRLDAAVNCAGVEGPRSAVTDYAKDTVSITLDINIIGTLLCMKHEIKAMIQQGSGSIVNISSIYGSKGYPKNALYAASKHAIEGLTKSAALEVASLGIRINAVAPGPIKTEMFHRTSGGQDREDKMISKLPTKRIGQPLEVAEAIYFLCFGGAPYITGQILGIDGGILAS